MNARALCFATVLFVTSCATEREESPRVGYRYPHEGRYLTPVEIDEITAFTQTVEGISHHVLLISVTSPTDVEVETGRLQNFDGGWHDTVHIKKVHGRWKILSKDRVKVIATGS